MHCRPSCAEAPSAAGVPTDDQAAATTSATPRARRRILVADDQALVRDSLAELLATEEHEVRPAADGAQAIDIAEASASLDSQAA